MAKPVVIAPPDLARTIILGNSGSGKSWLAERLARQLGSQAIDLDAIHWLPGAYNARRDSAEARASVRGHAAEDRWIIEGVFGWLASEALPRATSIVLLDLPDAECVTNVQARGIRRGADEASHAALVEWVKEYRVRQNANAFVAHLAMFDAFAGPKVRLSSRADLAAQVDAAAGTSRAQGRG